MSEEKKKINRREYIKYIGAGVAGLAIGGALGYLTAPGKIEKITETITKTETTTAATVTKTITGPGTTVTVTSSVTPTITPRKRVITVWHGDAEPVARITENLIKTEFNKLYPDIEVRYELAPEPFKEKLLVTIPAGTGPDLFEWNHDWIGTFVKADLLIPIDDLVTIELKEKFVESAFRAGQYQGKLYTLPISAEAGAFAYNKDMLGTRPVPTTTDELVTLMKEFKAKGLYGISFPLVPFLVSGFVHAFGGWFWDDETRTVGVNSPETKQAMKWILDTFKPYMSEDASWDPQVVLFTEKKTPFAINGPWMLGSWRDAKINFGITTLPEISEIKKKPMPYTGVKSIYMTKCVRDREAAWAFMVWATTSKERIYQRAKQLGYIPVLKEVLNLPDIKADPIISAFAEQVALGKPMASGPEMVAVWGPMQDALNAMWSGAKSVDKALDDAQKEIEEAIKKMGS
jgi:arabinogalactan oligomer/maltooligosaccharide transport system substrate-binding protein